jgi:predicted dehydrogenase
MEPIKVGVIGAGYWGPNLIRNFYQLPEAELEMVCDLNIQRLEHIQSRFQGVKTTRNYRDVLESDVEAVVIATPVSTHYPLAKDCLMAEKHIMVEKPFVRSSEEGKQLIALSQKVGKLIMTGHTFLYNPAVNAIKEIIKSGELGRIYYINCTRVNLGLYQPDVNVVWDLAPHDVSILMYILDADPIVASARGGMYVKPGVHDVAYVTLYFPHEILADMRVSWIDPCKIRRITVVGSKKMLVYDDIETDKKVLVYDKGVDLPPYTDTLEEFHMSYRLGEGVPYPLVWDEPLKLECLHFLDCIRTGKTPRSDGQQGLKIVQILETAQKSLMNGGCRENLLW